MTDRFEMNSAESASAQSASAQSASAQSASAQPTSAQPDESSQSAPDPPTRGLVQIGLGLKRWYRRQVLPAIADLRLAIALLLVIAGVSTSGTVIEQGRSLAFYQANYPDDPALFGFLSWKVLLALGLDHVYRTWWFLALLILFGASLLSCTFTRQLLALSWFSRPGNFYTQPRQFQKLLLSAELDCGSLTHLEPLLQRRGYRIVQRDQALYAHKGLVGRIAPVVVHASMLLVLLGAIGGALTGFLAQELIPSGETFTVQHIFDAGPWSGPQVPKDWSVRVNRFWIDYAPEGRIEQFYSDLSVLDREGTEVDRQTIHVNKPLRYRGVTFYQADWGISGVQVQLNQSPVFQFPMAELETDGRGRLWGAWVPTKPDLSEGVSLVAKDLQGTVLVYGMDGRLVGTLRRGMRLEVNGIQLVLREVVGSTGLQIKADPGIPMVYLGFGLLMLSVALSYVSHTQVWALEEGDRFYVGGRTNRAQVTFERELLGVIEELDLKA